MADYPFADMERYTGTTTALVADIDGPNRWRLFRDDSGDVLVVVDDSSGIPYLWREDPVGMTIALRIVADEIDRAA